MGKLLDEQAKSRIKRDLAIECIGSVAIVVFLALVVLVFCVNVCFGAETKTIKKSVSQSTSSENSIRKQDFNACVQQTGSRSKCYYLYY